MPRATVSANRRAHILDGDGIGGSGGHRSGANIPGKTEFPAEWTDDEVISVVEEVANDPGSSRLVQPNLRIRLDGVRRGISVRVIVENDGVTICTAFPTNTPPNP